MTQECGYTGGPLLQVRGLGVNLGMHRALDGIGFEAADGQTIAVIGPNGAGKSTLIRAILGLIEPTDGSITLHGRGPAQADPALTGYVPQLKRLDRSFPATSCELVASGLLMRWPGRLSRRVHDRVVEAMELVGAAHLTHKPVKWLSGGEYQRVYIARALVKQPQLLLLDEPATGIDALGEDDLYHYLERYQEQSGAAIMMITHDWLAARHHADCALLLNRRQYGFGPAAEILSRDNLVDLFGHSQHTHHHHNGVSIV